MFVVVQSQDPTLIWPFVLKPLYSVFYWLLVCYPMGNHSKRVVLFCSTILLAAVKMLAGSGVYP